jgi:hypothetical protein
MIACRCPFSAVSGIRVISNGQMLIPMTHQPQNWIIYFYNMQLIFVCVTSVFIMHTVFIHFHTGLMIELLFMQRQINDRNLNRVTVYWWQRRSGRYSLTVSGSCAGRGRKFISYPKRPDGRWGPHTTLLNGCRGSFPGAEQSTICWV